MKNVNTYNQEKFFEEFTQTNVYKQLKNDFDSISFRKFYWMHNPVVTPRQSIGDRDLFRTGFSAVPFYYLNYLLEKNPQQIYDLGCGWNIFKRYIPNLIGIGAEEPESNVFYADIHDYVDSEFIQGHRDYFESVFSICALHFRPLEEFAQVVEEFYSMIKPQGRGFLALNLKRMTERSTFMSGANNDQLDAYCRSELSKLSHIKFLVVDIDLEILNEGMDGNIRLVMEK